jgi:hypothetical protein
MLACCSGVSRIKITSWDETADKPSRNRERQRGASRNEDESENGKRDRKAGWKGMLRRELTTKE